MITKAVIPAAGLGTRFLPATKAMPNEMLPVVDKPAIQYVVEEAVASGLDDILMIIGRNKNALANHFDGVTEFELNLQQKGDHARVQRVHHSNALADIRFVRQGDPKGLGHAVLRARKHIGDESFAVLLGDDLIDERDELLATMLEQSSITSASVIALMEVPPDLIHMYGCAVVEQTNLSIIGRYVLRPEIFDVLETTVPGEGGEIQLSDALQVLAADDMRAGGVYGVVFSGRRYDTGDRLDYIKSIVQLALDREDLGPELRPWVKELASGIS